MFKWYKQILNFLMPSVMLTPDMFQQGGYFYNGQTPPQAPAPVTKPMGNPFTSAMSGTQNGTLQDYINRMTMMAQQAQGGGLLGIQPQQYQAGNAGGSPYMGSLPQQLSPLAFGNRSWMGK